MSDDVDLKRSRRKKSIAPAEVDRLPPHSIEAEQGVLGSIFLNPKECMPEVQSRGLSPEVFYDNRHQTIYETLCDMANDNDPIDSITVQARLNAFQQLDAIGGTAYLSSLPDAVPSAANVGFYVNVVLEKYQLRKLIALCTGTVARVYEHEGEPKELLDHFEAEALRVRVDLGREVSGTCKAEAYAVLRQIQEAQERPGGILGLSTGFPTLDTATDGFQNGDMIVVAGLTSGGKTALALQFIEHMAIMMKIPCAIFSMEMLKSKLLARMISSFAGVSVKSVRRGEVDLAGVEQLKSAVRHVAAAPIYIDDEPNLTITQVRARARRMYQRFGVRMFVVDYIQLLESERRKGDSREQEVANTSKGIKAMARELGVPVIGLAQLNRDFERDADRKPRMSDLRESARIGQDCDLCLMIYRPPIKPEEAKKPEVPVNIFIAKQRDGMAGIDVPLVFQRYITRFKEPNKIEETDLPIQETA